MTNTPRTFDEHLLLEAADWWTRLRDPQGTGSEVITRLWLDWVAQDDGHLAAFEYINDFGERLGTLDATARRQLVNEFAPHATPSRHWWGAAAAAAALVLAIGGNFLLRGHATNDGMLQATYATVTGQNRDIVLADGSKVTLGGASRLRVRFADGKRQVALEAGEAYFQVAHDMQHPFEVGAGGITVRDIGTAFDVRRTDGEVAVAVTQGQVRVAVSGDTARTLDAGAEQRVLWNATTHALSLGTTTPEQAAGWRSNHLEFVDEPLPVVIASVNRYSNKPVRLEGAELAALSFTGTVHVDDIDGWLRALPQVFPLQVDTSAHAVTLSARKAAVQRR
ncbi:FecR domain-containing protein [Rhodanobacter sp. DHG33]|uniref:FecR family protein n=1 Tax=Rhodanobacter sp. DHG33 TaxID=2775921 RepID=UPI0017847EB8|nr:FecR domain-containing protein [Rhodanobacter sp. DHG33]MBD8898264.1 FecR domain-containing protein [Rhodanobacter sp. DHG33]